MKLPGIFRFELAYQVRRVWPWLMFGALLVISFLVTRDASLADALYEDFFINSPFAIAKTTVVGGLFWLLACGIIAGEAGARDVATGMHPLSYTVPVSKAEYLAGRFLAALALNLVLLLAVQTGILLGVYVPGMVAQAIGPFRPAAFLTAYLYISVPTAFAATAIQFLLAERAGRAMAGYFGSLLMILTGFFIATVVRFFVRQDLGMLLDPIGVHFVLDDLAHQWTAYEKTWSLLSLEGTLLKNRLVWTAIGLGALSLAYSRFRFAHRTEGRRWLWWRRGRALAPLPSLVGVRAGERVSIPSAPRAFTVGIGLRQALTVARSSFRAMARSWAGVAMLVAIPAMTVIILLDQLASLGVPMIPGTMLVLRELTGGLTAEMASEPVRWVIVPLFIVFFAGELVWRERDADLAELTDALPLPEWVFLLGRYIGLALMLAAFYALLAASGIVTQLIARHYDFELGLYAKVLFGLQLPDYLLFAMLAMAIHVLVNQKYIGHLLALLAYGWIAALARMVGIEHNMLIYGAGPGFSYTDMLGFADSIVPWLWFKLYWAAWAVLLAVCATLLWMRGRESRLAMRLRSARSRFTRRKALVAASAAGLVLTLGGFIFYNTNVLNEYIASSDVEELRAEYERRYGRYVDAPKPELTKAEVRVEIHTDRRAAEFRGTYHLVNRGDAPIDTIHISMPSGAARVTSMSFDRQATLVMDDVDVAYRIYSLAEALQPGDSLKMEFEAESRRRGFTVYGHGRAVTSSASYITAWAFPIIGYQRTRELTTSSQRRKYGLEPRPLLASLYDSEGREIAARGGGIMFEAIVGTDEDQVAVAPGALRRTWTENGRRYFHYATSAPIGDEWVFYSARYAMREESWNGVTIRIYHYPEHTAHVDGIARSARRSLQYYSEQFGPYPYDHLTIIEHPGAPGSGAHADPSIISHGEGFAYWIQLNPKGLDLPYYVLAHEVAHQWTLPYALTEGLPFLAEGLASYSAIQFVKATRGEEQLQRLLAFMRQPFPYKPIKRGEPLLRAVDPYQSYRKGPLSMYALSGYMGVDRVNGAVRRLIARHDSAGAPLATTLDLYAELKAVTPDSLLPLLRDLFEVNTVWRLVAPKAKAEKAGEGMWQVTMDVRALKQTYDSTGVETEVPMDEWVQIGVFARPEPGSPELSAPLYLQWHRIKSGEQTITVTVPGEPVLAGVDPYHLLDLEELDDDDNVVPVEIAGVSGADSSSKE